MHRINHVYSILFLSKWTLKFILWQFQITEVVNIYECIAAAVEVYKILFINISYFKGLMLVTITSMIAIYNIKY